MPYSDGSYYCDSDEDPHSGGAQKDIPPRGHAKIRLNLARTYGRTQIWNPTSGVRELVQNWFDGILQKHQVEADDVVVVEKTRSKKSEICNIPLASTDPQPKKIVFLASIPLQSNGGKPPCVAQVIYTDNGNPLRRKLELINFDVALLRKNLLMGQTSKQEDANAIGGHGEGMKVGILALKRNSYNVVYHTNSERWGFKHEYDENVGEHSLVVRCTNARSTKDGCVHRCDKDTHVLVEGLSLDDIKFGHFLFLCPPSESSILRAKKSYCPGYICTGDGFRRKLFIKGIFVKEYSQGTRNHIYYGYNITGHLPLNRDRDLPESNQLSAMISSIWAALLYDEYTIVYAGQSPVPSPPDSASNRYLELFAEDEKCIDIADVDYYFRPEVFRGKEVARLLLFTYLLRQRGANSGRKIWLYGKSTDDSEKQCRIIHTLQRLPIAPPDSLYKLFDKHKLIRTADAERQRLFQLRPDTTAFESRLAFPHHVRHLLNVIRASHSSTQHLNYVWKDAKDINLDVFLTDKTLYLNDRNLSIEYVHKAVGNVSPCVAYDSRSDDDDDIFICDCSVMDLVSQIADNTMTRLPRHEMRAANALNRSLVALFPRSLKIKPPPRRFGYPDKMELTWTCLAHSAFTVVIKPGRQSLNNELKVPIDLDEEEEAQCDAPVNHSGDIVSDINYIITIDTIALLSDYHPGHVYTVQVYANRSHFPVAYSQPLLFECPLNCVDELSGKMRSGTLFVSFTTVRGACRYEIITIFPDEVRNTDLTDCTEWSKKISGKPPICVKVSAISADGVRSYTAMTVDVIAESAATRSQSSETPSTVAASTSKNQDPPKGKSAPQKPRGQNSKKGKRQRKGKKTSSRPIPEPNSDSEESEDDVEYEFAQNESETDDDDPSDDDWTEHVVGRSKRTTKVETTLNHDRTTICGIEVHVNDVLEVELGTSKSQQKSQHRFAHFLIYVETISQVQKNNSDFKFTLEGLKYLTVHDFLDPCLGKDPLKYRHIESLSEESREFLLLPDDTDYVTSVVSVADITKIIAHHGKLPEAPHWVGGTPAGFRCGWALQVNNHVREHLCPLDLLKGINRPVLHEKPVCPTTLAAGDFFCGAGIFMHSIRGRSITHRLRRILQPWTPFSPN
ncbi:hypothetical protein EDD85DRAFT_12522 [Armillaria nabsnona]|nr:hypothetical protein EDD85DRAFT_12522 [Armillaria nabsnona]